MAPARIAGWRQPAMGNIDRTRYSGTGLCPVRCARRCRGVCRSVGEGVPRADDSSEAEQRRMPWPPVRIRFVHHWIAQMGRASDINPTVAGSTPAPTPDCKSGNRDVSPVQGTPRAACRPSAMERGRRRVAAGTTPAPRPRRGSAQRSTRSTDRALVAMPPPTAPAARLAAVQGRFHLFPSIAAAVGAPPSWRSILHDGVSCGSNHQSQQGEQRHVLDQEGRDR